MNALRTMPHIFFRYYKCNNEVLNMEKRTQEEWRKLHENAIIAILSGKTANPVIGTMSSIIDQAIWGADDLIKRLKEREEKQCDHR